MLKASIGILCSKPRLVGLFFMLVASLMIWTAWDAVLTRRVERLHERLRREGRPVASADLNHNSTLPDDQNAFILQTKAIQSTDGRNIPQPRIWYVAHDVAELYNDDWMNLAKEAEEAISEIFALAHEATKYPGEISVCHQSAAPSTDANPCHEVFQLSFFLFDSVRYNTIKGDPSLALDRLLDALHIARTIETDPSTWSVYDSSEIYSNAAQCAQLIAANLKSGNMASCRDKLLKVQSIFRDETRRHALAKMSLDCYRLDISGMAGEFYSKTWISKPLAKVFELYSYPGMLEFTKVIESGDHRSALAEWERARPSKNNYRGVLNDDCERFAGNIDNYRDSLLDTRIAIAAIACQLYRLDHDNQFPESLEMLIPEYLDSIPLHPGSAHPIVVEYLPKKFQLPDGTPRPVLVWPGSPDLGPNPTRPIFHEEWLRRVAPNQRGIWYPCPYRDLTYFLPLNGPTQAAQNQADQPDEAGDTNQPEKQAPEPHAQ